MSDENRIEQASRFLFDEHQSRRPFVPIPDAFAPRTAEEAYATQEAYGVLLVSSRGPIAGHKIALTTPVMQKLAGFHEPAFGLILASTIHPSPCVIHGADYQRLGIECEIAVRLNADLPAAGAPYSRGQVAEAVGALMPAFELIEDRNADYSQFASQALSAIADNVWNGGIVLGPPITAWRDLDLGAAHGSLSINGTLIGDGHGRDVMGHPLDALAWLANMLARRGKQLSQDIVVMTGSIVATKFVKAGDAARFSIDALGEVNLIVT